MWTPRTQLRLLALIIWAVFAIILTTQSAQIPVVQFVAVSIASTEWGDALGHAGLFAIFTAVAYLALNIRLSSSPALWLAIIITLILGTATEISQILVADRSPSFSDLLANWLGVFFIGFIIANVSQRSPKAIQC